MITILWLIFGSAEDSKLDFKQASFVVFCFDLITFTIGFQIALQMYGVDSCG